LREGANPILALRGVSKQFELQGQRIEALRDANLRVRPGEFVCLIGASGCGKSTLLRIVAGFETATRGQALMWDRPITGPGPERGMVFQDYGLFPWLTVRARATGAGGKGDGRALHHVGRLAAFCRRLSASAFGRHEAACGDRPRARQ
jgi:NitT/TauT family transport system ATP-binding protein